MIVIEIRIGREAPVRVAGPSLAAPRHDARLADPRALASAFRPRPTHPERWIWRLGRRGIAAAVASVLGVASLAFVPGSSNAEVSTIGNSTPRHDAAGAGVGAWQADAAPVAVAVDRAALVRPGTSRVDTELDRLARDLTASALARVRGDVDGHPIDLTVLRPSVEVEHVEHVASEAPRADLATDVPDTRGWPADAPASAPAGAASRGAPTVGSVPEVAPTPILDTTPAQEETLVERRRPNTGSVAEQPLAAMTSVGTAAAVPAPKGTGHGAVIADAPAATATDGNAGHAPAGPVFLTISRGSAAADERSGRATSEVQALRDRVSEMHEQAFTGGWASISSELVLVRAALAGLTAPLAEGEDERAVAQDAAGLDQLALAAHPELHLSLSKLEARAALHAGDLAAAMAALDALGNLRDDEAQALQAVALLRSGHGARAVETYRDLVARAPQDARLWLGLGMALESTEAAPPNAMRFAYLQALELTDDEAVRSAARSRLAPPRA